MMMSNLVSSDAADLMSRTARYCALSNMRDLDSIESMITTEDSVVYGSEGIVAIMEGMRRFFATFPHIYWEYAPFKMYQSPSSSTGVEFEFKRYWTDPVAENVMVIEAAEVIEFDSKGMVKKIYYTRLPSDPVVYGKQFPSDQPSKLLEARKIIADTANLYLK